jgi:anti-sigma B factor antagonist
MSAEEAFHYEVEKSGNLTTTIRCHGKLVSGVTGQLKDEVKELIPQGGNIVLDFADVQYLDSSGLGVLVGLKASAMRAANCRLTLENASPRVKDLLSLTNVASLFAS